MCSITPVTAKVGSSNNRMRGPGIGCWFSDRSNCSHWSFEAAVLPLTFTLTSENLSLYTTLLLLLVLIQLCSPRCWHLNSSYCCTRCTVFFKTRGHLSRLAWPMQRDGLSCLASPRLALRCAAWPGKTNPDLCSQLIATSGCSHRYYNSIVHNAKCINIPFFSVRQAVFLYKHECLK